MTPCDPWQARRVNRRLSPKRPQWELNTRPEYQQPLLVGHCKQIFPIIRNDTGAATGDNELPPGINGLNIKLTLELIYGP
jgi:hypothetical protein